MPNLEDMLGAAVSGDELTPDPVTPEVDPAVPEVDPVVPPVADPAADPAKPATDPATDPTDPADPVDPAKPEDKKPKANPMKEMRTKYNETKANASAVSNAINKYTAGDYKFNLKDHFVDGKVDFESLNNAMAAADTETKATENNITPEIQRQLDRIDADKKELERDRLKVSMDRSLVGLQSDFGLKGADINNFFKDSMEQQKNPYKWIAQGGTLGDLYNIVYQESIMKDKISAAVATERAKWDKEHDIQSKVPASNPGQPNPAVNLSGNGLSLDSLLKDATK